MKKIIAFALIIACALCLVACKTDGDPQLAEQVAAYSTALATAPVSATVSATMDSALAELNGVYTVSYDADGVATVNYTLDVLNGFVDGEAPDEQVSETTGTATVSADGAVTAGDLGAIYATLIAKKLSLDVSKITADVGSGVLSATVSEANAASVVPGIAGNVGDLTLNIALSEGKITTISLGYATANGDMSIRCIFAY